MMITLEVKHCHSGKSHHGHTWMDTGKTGGREFYCDGKPLRERAVVRTHQEAKMERLEEENKKLKERLVSWEDEAGRLRRIAADHGKTVDYYRETLTDIFGFDEQPSDAELLRAVQNRFKRIEAYEDRPSKGDYIALRKDLEKIVAERTDLANARLKTIREQDKKLRQIRAITEEKID